MYTTRKQFLKQAGFALAGSFLPYSKLFAGNTHKTLFAGNTSHPIDCPTTLYTDISDGTEFFYYYKSTGNIIKDIAYQLDDGNGCVDVTFVDDFLCGTFDNHTTDTGPQETALRYKAIYPYAYDATLHPTGHDYAVALPVVALFHPGGFRECTTLDDDFLHTLALELAMKGYICLVVEYRTGRLEDESPTAKNWTAQQQLATYRGIQDVRGALKSIVKRNTAFSGTGEDFHRGLFKINTDQFFIGGASAGTVITVNAAYLRDQTMANQIFVSAGTSDLTIEQALGGIDVNRYFGHTSDFPVIRGILACWGALLLPWVDNSNTNAVSFFTSTDSNANPPIIAFHGALDPEIAYYSDDKKQDYKNSYNPKYKKETRCLDSGNSTDKFLLKATGSDHDKVYVTKLSGLDMYNLLKDSAINRKAELYTDCNGGHGLKFTSTYFPNYGTSYTDETAVTKYIAERAAVFFPTIMIYNATHLLNHPPFDSSCDTHFIDCQNLRVCGGSDNNSCTLTECENNL